MPALITEQLSDVLVVTFNRPEIRSPLSVAVLEELAALVDRLTWEAAPPRLVFTGRDGVFASGADLREIAALGGAEDVKAFARRGQNLMAKVAALDSVAAVDGFCFGGALDLALACRRRIASPRAEFCHPGATLGIMTGWGGTQRLPRLIGRGRALEMFMTGARVPAAEALAIGLVDEVSEDPLAAALGSSAAEQESG